MSNDTFLGKISLKLRVLEVFACLTVMSMALKMSFDMELLNRSLTATELSTYFYVLIPVGLGLGASSIRDQIEACRERLEMEKVLIG